MTTSTILLTLLAAACPAPELEPSGLALARAFIEVSAETLGYNSDTALPPSSFRPIPEHPEDRSSKPWRDPKSYHITISNDTYLVTTYATGSLASIVRLGQDESWRDVSSDQEPRSLPDFAHVVEKYFDILRQRGLHVEHLNRRGAVQHFQLFARGIPLGESASFIRLDRATLQLDMVGIENPGIGLVNVPVLSREQAELAAVNFMRQSFGPIAFNLSQPRRYLGFPALSHEEYLEDQLSALEQSALDVQEGLSFYVTTVSSIDGHDRYPGPIKVYISAWTGRVIGHRTIGSGLGSLSLSNAESRVSTGWEVLSTGGSRIRVAPSLASNTDSSDVSITLRHGDRFYPGWANRTLDRFWANIDGQKRAFARSN